MKKHRQLEKYNSKKPIQKESTVDQLGEGERPTTEYEKKLAENKKILQCGSNDMQSFVECDRDRFKIKSAVIMAM